MNVILLQDVNKLGKKGDVVKVNDGYARNFILPKKLGLEATEKNLKDLAVQKAEEEKRQQEIYQEAVVLGDELKKKTVKLSIKGGEGGKTFGSITAKEIADIFRPRTERNRYRRKDSYLFAPSQGGQVLRLPESLFLCVRDSDRAAGIPQPYNKEKLLWNN